MDNMEHLFSLIRLKRVSECQKESISWESWESISWGKKYWVNLPLMVKRTSHNKEDEHGMNRYFSGQ